MNFRLAAACLIATAVLVGCRGEDGEDVETTAAPATATAEVEAAPEAAAPAELPDAAAEARSRAALEQRLRIPWCRVFAGLHRSAPRKLRGAIDEVQDWDTVDGQRFLTRDRVDERSGPALIYALVNWDVEPRR